jgi:uncharacterized protein YciI
MPQWLVIAHDGTDEGAQARRMAVRPTHMENIRPLVESRRIIAGGATLDEAGNVTGSAVFVEFDTRAELDAWLTTDPYVTGKVWKRIEVTPFRLVVLAKA